MEIMDRACKKLVTRTHDVELLLELVVISEFELVDVDVSLLVVV